MEPTKILLPDDEIEQISELVSKRVEDKLFARFGKWVVINLLVVGGIAGGGLIAFFNLRSDVQHNNSTNAFQDQRISEQSIAAAATRNEVVGRLDRLSDQMQKIQESLILHRINTGSDRNGKQP